MALDPKKGAWSAANTLPSNRLVQNESCYWHWVKVLLRLTIIFIIMVELEYLGSCITSTPDANPYQSAVYVFVKALEMVGENGHQATSKRNDVEKQRGSIYALIVATHGGDGQSSR